MNLAVIGQITSIRHIAGADFIREARVDCGPSGVWQGVVGLDIKPDDLVTVFLQDAVLPPDERWAFMERHKWRVRMARFKGVPSECVIIKGAPEMPPGTDLTKALGVTKHTKPVPQQMSGQAKGNFPSFIPKTDEPNFQTVRHANALIHGSDWVATLKCDGTSCTVWNDEDGMHVASRNWELAEFDENTGAGNVYWQTARRYDFSKLPSETALQFEIVGPGIQGNPMGLDCVEGRAFTLWDYGVHERRHQDELEEAAQAIGMPVAKVLARANHGTLLDHDALRKLAEVRYDNGRPGEGIVIRDLNQKWSMKVINLLYRELA